MKDITVDVTKSKHKTANCIDAIRGRMEEAQARISKQIEANKKKPKIRRIGKK